LVIAAATGSEAASPTRIVDRQADRLHLGRIGLIFFLVLAPRGWPFVLLCGQGKN